MNPAGTQTLDTHRLTLRRFRTEDAEEMFRSWTSDPEAARYLSWPPHSSAEVTRGLLEDWTAQYTDGKTFRWAIEWKENGRVIGSIEVVRLEEATDAAEIGYCLSRAFWGRGIMPEALRAVMDYLFDTAEINRIFAKHDVNNPRSGRVMEKAGMRKEGILRSAGRNNQGICDLALYAALRSGHDPVSRRAAAPVTVRFAREEELDRINELRRQVNDLHVSGKPEVFKPGFCDELRDHIYTIWNDPRQEIAVAEQDGKLCGFAVLNHLYKPENPFMFERDFLDVDEFCVDAQCRRQGAGSAMIRFIRDYAREKGFRRVELNMWEFNREALAFYEATGFTTYRRYLEMKTE